jgi:hypothetical protein
MDDEYYVSNNRLTLGNRTLLGAACYNSWFSFDDVYVGEWPADLLKFVEQDGKLEVTFPAVNLTAWKV